ncbi:hypothetical protein ABKN59_005335 [Abortiporus biennis]
MAASPARYGLASVNVLELIPIRSLATTENLQRGFSVSSWHVGVTDTLKAIAKLVSSRRYTPPTAMRSFPYPFNNFTCCDLRSTLLYLHHGRAFELNMDRVFQKLKKFAHNLCTSSSSDKVSETWNHSFLTRTYIRERNRGSPPAFVCYPVFFAFPCRNIDSYSLATFHYQRSTSTGIWRRGSEFIYLILTAMNYFSVCVIHCRRGLSTVPGVKLVKLYCASIYPD